MGVGTIIDYKLHITVMLGGIILVGLKLIFQACYYYARFVRYLLEGNLAIIWGRRSFGSISVGYCLFFLCTSTG